MSIEFYRARDQRYGWLSNFKACPLEFEGRSYRTSEHAYQAQKMVLEEDIEAVRMAPSPLTAAWRGRSKKRQTRPHWDQIKSEIMKRVLLAKFRQHSDLRDLLLATGNEVLIEKTRRDDYWGSGPDGNGLNMLGRLLMEVRDEFRKEIGAVEVE